jgi:hypothetical protein
MRSRPKSPSLRPVTDTEINTVIEEMHLATPAPSMHELFDRQVRDMMEDAGMSEEEKQSVLVAMSCPCCGGGASSFTFKLRPKD